MFLPFRVAVLFRQVFCCCCVASFFFKLLRFHIRKKKKIQIFVVSDARIPRRIAQGSLDAALFTSWQACLARSQGCNYKIHNPYELVLRASSGQLASQLGCKLAIEQAVRATLLNSKKTREDALYRGITTETRRWRWVGATVNGAAVGG